MSHTEKPDTDALIRPPFRNLAPSTLRNMHPSPWSRQKGAGTRAQLFWKAFIEMALPLTFHARGGLGWEGGRAVPGEVATSWH